MEIIIRVVSFPAMLPVALTRTWLVFVSDGVVTWLDGTPQRLPYSDVLHLERACIDYARRVASGRDEERCYAQVWDKDARRHVFFEVAAR